MGWGQEQKHIKQTQIIRHTKIFDTGMPEKNKKGSTRWKDITREAQKKE